MRRGELAPGFSLPDERGVASLGEFLAAGPVVLFFYPAAMTAGCTAESCHFRDLGAEFAALGRPGSASATTTSPRSCVSARCTASTTRFSPTPTVPSPASTASAAAFGPLPTRRWTFVIGADGRIAEVVRSETRMAVHADRALAALRELAAR